MITMVSNQPDRANRRQSLRFRERTDKSNLIGGWLRWLTPRAEDNRANAFWTTDFTDLRG